MSDTNEQRDEAQQGAGSAQANGEDQVNATDAAKKLAQERNMDLAGVEGTGEHGQITKADVQRTYERTDTTARSAEATRSTSQHPLDPCRQDPCEPDAVALGNSCQQPTEEAILEQYAVLTAILGSPTEGFFNLKGDKITIVDNPDPLATHDLTVIELDPNDSTGQTISKINFPGAMGSGTLFACNFFAPMPPSAPVKWPFPTPQALLPSDLNSCQICLEESCDPCGHSRSNGMVESVGQRP